MPDGPILDYLAKKGDNMRRTTLTLLIQILFLYSGIALAATDTLDIFGNANMDDVIDEDDVEYVQGIIDEINEATELADANYDGEINQEDITQIEAIIDGEAAKITLIDSVGRIMTVNVPVERVIPLHMRHASAICALGGKEMIVGVDDTVIERELLFPYLCKLPSVGKVREPDAEQIIILDPDLIVTFTNMPTSAELEDKLHGSVAVIRFDLSRAKDLKEEMVKLGYLIGDRNAAEDYVEWYDLYMDTVKERVFEIPDEDRSLVFMERERSGEVQIMRWAYATDTGYSDLCDVAGGVNVAQGYVEYNGDVESEWVMTQNPDVIVGLSYGAGYKKDDDTPLKDYRDEIMDVPGFDNLEAVKNGRVHVISGDFAVGPQLVIGAVAMAKWLYPEEFEDMDVDAIHEEFLRNFLGSDYDLEEHGAFVYPPVE